MSKQKLKTEDQKIQEAQQLLAAAKLKRQQIVTDYMTQINS